MDYTMKKDNRRNLTTWLAYIAGFIDGEGCIRIKKSNQSGNSYYVTLQVTNSDPNPLNKIKEIFKGKVYRQEISSTGKTIWQYYSTCAEAVDTLRVLVGFLITKKTQAQLAIKYQDEQGELDAEHKHALYWEMRELKKYIHEDKDLL